MNPRRRELGFRGVPVGRAIARRAASRLPNVVRPTGDFVLADYVEIGDHCFLQFGQEWTDSVD